MARTRSTADAFLRARYDEVVAAAHDELERRARAVLRAHPNLGEFVMGMGTALFTTNAGDTIGTEERAYMAPVNDLLDEWDEYLRLTGRPMRFTANGEKRTDWGVE